MADWQGVRAKADGALGRAVYIDESRLFPSGLNVRWDDVLDTYFIPIEGRNRELVPPVWIVVPAAGATRIMTDQEFTAGYEFT